MRREHHYYVYILSSRSRRFMSALRIGCCFEWISTAGEFDGFTKKYKVHRLVYFERFQYIGNAIAREKEIKGWLREKKVALIVAENPTWEDLYVAISGGATGEKQVLRVAQDDKFEK